MDGKDRTRGSHPLTMADEQTISGDALEKLTGLGDRRIRQLAKEGHFPPPVKGQYKLVKTVRGLFAYYQTMSQRYTGDRAKVEEERERDRARREKADADIKDMIRARMKGELLPAREVELTWYGHFTLARQKVENWSGITKAQKDELLEELIDLPVSEYVKSNLTIPKENNSDVGDE